MKFTYTEPNFIILELMILAPLISDKTFSFATNKAIEIVQSTPEVANVTKMLNFLPEIYSEKQLSSNGISQDSALKRDDTFQGPRPASEADNKILDLKLRLRQARLPTLKESVPVETSMDKQSNVALELKELIDRIMRSNPSDEFNKIDDSTSMTNRQATTTARPTYDQIPRPLLFEYEDDEDLMPQI